MRVEISLGVIEKGWWGGKYVSFPAKRDINVISNNGFELPPAHVIYVGSKIVVDHAEKEGVIRLSLHFADLHSYVRMRAPSPGFALLQLEFDDFRGKKIEIHEPRIDVHHTREELAQLAEFMRSRFEASIPTHS